MADPARRADLTESQSIALSIPSAKRATVLDSYVLVVGEADHAQLFFADALSRTLSPVPLPSSLSVRSSRSCNKHSLTYHP